PLRYSVPENSLNGFWNANSVPKNSRAQPGRHIASFMLHPSYRVWPAISGWPGLRLRESQNRAFYNRFGERQLVLILRQRLPSFDRRLAGLGRQLRRDLLTREHGLHLRQSPRNRRDAAEDHASLLARVLIHFERDRHAHDRMRPRLAI